MPTVSDPTNLRKRIAGIRQAVADFMATMKGLRVKHRQEMEALTKELAAKKLEEVKKEIEAHQPDQSI
jgi:hypothetical protein